MNKTILNRDVHTTNGINISKINQTTTIGYENADILISRGSTHFQRYLQEIINIKSMRGGGDIVVYNQGAEYIFSGAVDMKSNINIKSDGAIFKQKEDVSILDGLIRTDSNERINNANIKGLHFKGIGQRALGWYGIIVAKDIPNNTFEVAMMNVRTVSTGGAGATTLIVDLDYFEPDEAGNTDDRYERKLWNIDNGESVNITNVTNTTTVQTTALPSDWTGDAVRVSLNLGKWCELLYGDEKWNEGLIVANKANPSSTVYKPITSVNGETIGIDDVTGWNIGDQVTQQTMISQRSISMNAYNSTVSNCEFSGYSYTHCLLYAGTGSELPKNITLKNNLIHGCSGFGVTNGAENVEFTNNISDDWNYDFCFIMNGNDKTGSNVVFQGNQSTKGNTKFDHRMWLWGGGGIDIASSNITASNNYIKNPYTQGFIIHNPWYAPTDKISRLDIGNNTVEIEPTHRTDTFSGALETVYSNNTAPYPNDTIENIRIHDNYFDDRIQIKGVTKGTIKNNEFNYIGHRSDAILATNNKDIDILDNKVIGFTNFINLTPIGSQTVTETLRYGRNILDGVSTNKIGTATTEIDYGL